MKYFRHVTYYVFPYDILSIDLGKGHVLRINIGYIKGYQPCNRSVNLEI